MFKEKLITLLLVAIVNVLYSQVYNQFVVAPNGANAIIYVKDEKVVDNKIHITIQAQWVNADLVAVQDFQSRVVLSKSNIIANPSNMLQCVSFDTNDFVAFNSQHTFVFEYNNDYSEGELNLSLNLQYVENEEKSKTTSNHQNFLLKQPLEINIKYYLTRNPLKIVRIAKEDEFVEKRLALVIGNSNYREVGKLANPVNDARAMEKTLEKLNFTVLSYENADLKTLTKAIFTFGNMLKDYNTSLFYYAGHGIQYHEINYLIPTDAKIYEEEDIAANCVNINNLLTELERSKTKTNIIILDACRNNPFEEQALGRSVKVNKNENKKPQGNGLAVMDAPSGTLIAFATAPGKTAADGTGSNGLYTSMLLEHMQSPGITILEMFQRVRTYVREKTNGEQIPWESTSLEGNFYFKR